MANWEMELIATGTSNWDYYLTPEFEDGSQAVYYKAKENSGAGSGIYCNVKRLRGHLIHLANVRYGANWNTIIPDDWKVVDEQFFESLGIV